MIACLSAIRNIRGLAGVVLAFIGVLLLSGCDNDHYAPELKYSLRSEPLVTDVPNSIPPRLDKPGELPTILTLLEEKDRKSVLEPAQLTPKASQDLDRQLDELFGTPLSPKMTVFTGATEDISEDDLDTTRQTFLSMGLEPATLAKGSELFRRHCLHCHGVTGNGRGPTAPWVNPHPRDYRQGVFKFTSSGQGAKPRRDDLLRTLREGIEGTSMPSFGLLHEDELQALISYVIHLSIRGEMEFITMRDVLKKVIDDAGIKGSLMTWQVELAKRWKAAESKTIKPEAASPQGPEQEASIKNGYKLFVEEKSRTGCWKCHNDYGRQVTFLYDTWGTIVRPANLTDGVYRGGRRPIDLYWRIHSGINGANMPASNTNLNSKEIWDIVNFLQVLPYPKMREKYGIAID